MNSISKFSMLVIAGLALSCNQSNNEGQITPEGTTVTNNVNSDMEKTRKPADVDTITSPGSNSADFNGRGNGTSNKDAELEK